MVYGWMGSLLEVDLSSGEKKKRAVATDFYETYLGGKGMNARIYYDRIHPEVEPLSPDNLLIISTGVLTGTMVPSANRAIFSFKSPQNRLHMHSAMGGFWPVELKQTGHDSLIIKGQAAKPVYLWIHDDIIELRDAAHLWGKGTYETTQMIRKELNNDKLQVACIGPAGENLCYAASIESSVGASASRGGAGAVMGAKFLKAIAVYGTRDIRLARPHALFEKCEQILAGSGPFQRDMENFSYTMAVLNTLGTGMFGNLNETYPDLSPESLFKQDLDGIVLGFHEWLKKAEGSAACSNCGVKCRTALPLPGGGYAYLKCHLWNAFMVGAKIVDYSFVLECCRLSQDNGLDINAVSRCIAFAIDLYQQGIITKQDTGGMDLRWNDKEVVYSLIHDISLRRGFGRMLAEGVHAAASYICRGAENHAHHIKKLEYVPSAALLYLPYLGLTQAISDKVDISRNVSGPSIAWAGLTTEQRQALVDSPAWIYPKDYERYFLQNFSLDGSDHESGCRFAAYDDETYSIVDSIGLCAYWTVFLMNAPINSRALMAELVSHTTGLDISEDDLTLVGRRALNLVRAINVRSGLQRKDDSLSKIIHKTPPSPFLKPLDPVVFDKWLDRYYELKGWNQEGIPTSQTLQALGLEEVFPALKKMEGAHAHHTNHKN